LYDLTKLNWKKSWRKERDVGAGKGIEGVMNSLSLIYGVLSSTAGTRRENQIRREIP